MQHVNLFVFDLDGVITDPQNSVVDAAAVEHISSLLLAGNPIAINTGRSFAWVDANLLSRLRDTRMQQTFTNLFIVCEKGGESLGWNGVDFEPLPSRFALPQQAIDTCKELFDAHSDELTTMFWDETKQTMATIEKQPKADLNIFHEQQLTLVEMLQKTFVGQDVRIDPTTIATDVELPAAGKHAGAELIFEWISVLVETDNISCVCFGDSVSDYEMARYLAEKGVATTFVFVGKKDAIIEEHSAVTLLRTKALYALGTREYFAS